MQELNQLFFRNQAPQFSFARNYWFLAPISKRGDQ